MARSNRTFDLIQYHGNHRRYVYRTDNRYNLVTLEEEGTIVGILSTPAEMRRYPIGQRSVDELVRFLMAECYKLYQEQNYLF